MVVALLGVLKAGAAYVPIDPAHPAKWNNSLLREAAVSVLVAHSGAGALVPPKAVRTISADELDSPIAETAPKVAVSPDDLACVMFTSGSTGRPKGSASPHRATVRTFFGQGYAQFGSNETWLQAAPVSWDVLALELWSPLLHGGRCILAPGQGSDAAEIVRLVRRYQVTALWLSAGLFNVLADNYIEVFGRVNQVMTGGESPSMPHLRLVRETFPELRLVHGYGPVEGMVFTTWHPVTSEDLAGDTVPIGAPLNNTRVHVVDPAGDRVSVGDVGELLIGGDGVALGYLGRGALTAERFVPDPFGPPGGRLYRSGDQVRWLPSGVLEFVGRADRQVKIRGFRVELYHIEAALLRQPEVRQAVVMVREDMRGERKLVAYLVPSEPTEAAGLGQRLRAQLGGQLPEYMIPSAFVILSEYPLTANGKLDLKALQNPNGSRDLTLPSAMAPRTEMEKVISDIWALVLGIENLGVEDDFFQLGGDSIQMMRIVAMARTHGVSISLRTFYEHRTIAALAAMTESAADTDGPSWELRPRAERVGQRPVTPD
jgi:amino acid adenylation domain-containing protein